MPSTYLSLHYHIVFSTKHRDPLITPDWRTRLDDYIGGTVNGLDAKAEGVRGKADHVHLLVRLKSTHRLSDFMRELKKATSLWVHEEIGKTDFAWQEGYGAFTVSATSCEKVRTYIANQDEHHRTLSFRDELIGFLRKASVEYDPKYLD